MHRRMPQTPMRIMYSEACNCPCILLQPWNLRHVYAVVQWFCVCLCLIGCKQNAVVSIAHKCLRIFARKKKLSSRFRIIEERIVILWGIHSPIHMNQLKPTQLKSLTVSSLLSRSCFDVWQLPFQEWRACRRQAKKAVSFQWAQNKNNSTIQNKFL